MAEQISVAIPDIKLLVQRLLTDLKSEVKKASYVGELLSKTASALSAKSAP